MPHLVIGRRSTIGTPKNKSNQVIPEFNERKFQIPMIPISEHNICSSHEINKKT